MAQDCDASTAMLPDGNAKNIAKVLSECGVFRADPFIATQIDTARLIWHPHVHQYFSDKCSFFFLRYRRCNNEAIKGLQEKIQGFGARGAYVYAVLGHFDVLMRIWADGSTLEEIRSHIREMAISRNLYEAQEFQVDDIRLLLRESDIPVPTEEAISKATLDITNVANAAKYSNFTADTGALSSVKKLLDLGILRVARSSHLASCFRFAIILQVDAGVSAPVTLDSVEAFVTAYNKQNSDRPTITRCAVYSGFGHGVFLVSGIVADYEVLAKFSENLHLFLDQQTMPMRAETYLTAFATTLEYDRVDPHAITPAQEDYRLAFVIAQHDKQPDAAPLISQRISRANEITKIRQFFLANQGLLHTPFHPHLVEFFAARIENSAERLESMMRCFPRIEFRIADLWKKNLRSLSDSDPPIDTNKAMAALAEKAKLSPKEMGAPTFQNLSRVSDLSPQFAVDHIATILGTNWVTDFQITKLAAYRNDYAHGRVIGEPDYLENNWAALGALLGLIGRLYNLLHQ